MNKPLYKLVKNYLGREQTLLIVYGLITLLASIQKYLLPDRIIGDSGLYFTNYNNYVIFKNSFFHLLTNKNLYTLYLTEQWDLYKYSPTFALFMGLLAYLPDWLGLTLWNLLNTMLLFFGVKNLPLVSQQAKIRISWFVLIELLTSIQNAQSNGLILGLFIWSFIYLERGKLLWATLFILLSAFIKIFGLVGFILFLLYPRKLKAFFYTVVWTVFLVALPVLVIPYQQLISQYQNWSVLLQNDQSTSISLSVMGWLNTWFSVNPSQLTVLLIGMVLLLLPLLRINQYQSYLYRLLTLASLLIWVVIFNHKAESPTFIIAMGGIGLWYFTQPITPLNQTLVVLAFIFTSFSTTDLFPGFLRETIIVPYVLKAVFCIAIWIKIIYDLLRKDWKRIQPISTVQPGQLPRQ